jgi:hypothetical protein
MASTSGNDTNLGSPVGFDLNIETVLEHWTVSHAVREVIANALDEQVLSATDAPVIEKDANGTWRVRDFGRGIRHEHLTQNENPEKLAHPQLIGKFGVGLKDALATFHRQGIAVRLRSAYVEISIGMSSKHGFSDISTLHAFIDPPADPTMRGTDVEMPDLGDADMAAAKDYFLEFSGESELEVTKYGTVLERARGGRNSRAARIYVNGLLVAAEPNFLFSYNVTSLTTTLRKALNRERSNVGRTAYGERVKAILVACRGSVVAERLAMDLGGFAQGSSHEELTTWRDVAVHACRVLNAAERVVFATADQLADETTMVSNARQDGLRLVVVPSDVAIKLRGLSDLDDNPIRDLNQYQIEWDASFTYVFISPEQLTILERRIYDLTEEILKLASLEDRRRLVKEVLISETMRITGRGQEASGLWEPENKRIVVKRDQLRRVRDYAGTRLHEIGHATSDTGDVTAEFEEKLTRILGVVAEEAIRRGENGSH